MTRWPFLETGGSSDEPDWHRSCFRKTPSRAGAREGEASRRPGRPSSSRGLSRHRAWSGASSLCVLRLPGWRILLMSLPPEMGIAKNGAGTHHDRRLRMPVSSLQSGVEAERCLGHRNGLRRASLVEAVTGPEGTQQVEDAVMVTAARKLPPALPLLEKVTATVGSSLLSRRVPDGRSGSVCPHAAPPPVGGRSSRTALGSTERRLPPA